MEGRLILLQNKIFLMQRFLVMNKFILALAVAATFAVSGSSAFAGGYGYGGYGHNYGYVQPTIVVPSYRVQYVQPSYGYFPSYSNCYHGHCGW